MLIIRCDICKRDLPQPALSVGNAHFCQRCAPYSEEYLTEVVHITVEHTQGLIKAIDRYRNKFIQDRMNKLKVVPNESITVSG